MAGVGVTEGGDGIEDEGAGAAVVGAGAEVVGGGTTEGIVETFGIDDDLEYGKSEETS